jgi:hypothetical protein
MFPRGKTSNDRCPIGLGEAQELWLGAGSNGSLFGSREELVAAWQRGREYIMRLWGSHGRRPMGWWEFEAGDLKHPGYFRERSALWRAGQLTEVERAELEHEWKAAFQEAQAPDFTVNASDAELLKGDCARAAHYDHHDIPRELVKRWEKAARRQRARAERQPAAPAQEATT